MAKEAKSSGHDIEAVTQEISNIEDAKFRDFERTSEDVNVQRWLKSRHIQLIALGRPPSLNMRRPLAMSTLLA